MKGFKAFYLWAMNAKFFMGIYFTAIVFLTGILNAVFGVDTLRLIVLLEMLAVSLVMAFAQVLLLPDSVDFTRRILFGRSVLWMLLSAALTVGVSIWGGWFAGMPAWCPWLLGILMLGGCGAMLAGIRFEQEAATVRLNDALERFQKQSEK